MDKYSKYKNHEQILYNMSCQNIDSNQLIKYKIINGMNICSKNEHQHG